MSPGAGRKISALASSMSRARKPGSQWMIRLPLVQLDVLRGALHRNGRFGGGRLQPDALRGRRRGRRKMIQQNDASTRSGL